MRTHPSLPRRLLLPLSLLMTALMAIACGSGSTVVAPPPAPPVQISDGTQCMQQLEPDQAAQAQQYIASNGDSLLPATANADGSLDICFIDNTGVQHYYNQYDIDRGYISADTYNTYAYLYGRVPVVATPLYIDTSGGMNIFDAIVLSHMISVYGDGSYQPLYGYDPGSRQYDRYAPHTVSITNKTVIKQVSYGNQPVSFQQTLTQAPPKGYLARPSTNASPDTKPVKATPPKAGDKPAPEPPKSTIITNKQAIAKAPAIPPAKPAPTTNNKGGPAPSAAPAPPKTCKAGQTIDPIKGTCASPPTSGGQKLGGPPSLKATTANKPPCVKDARGRCKT